MNDPTFRKLPVLKKGKEYMVKCQIVDDKGYTADKTVPVYREIKMIDTYDTEDTRASFIGIHPRGNGYIFDVERRLYLNVTTQGRVYLVLEIE